jgi:hypothetical protein
MKIIETDNFARGDYPDEKFVNLPPIPAKEAQQIVSLINICCSGPDSLRYWMTAEDDYELQGPFEP